MRAVPPRRHDLRQAEATRQARPPAHQGRPVSSMRLQSRLRSREQFKDIGLTVKRILATIIHFTPITK